MSKENKLNIIKHSISKYKSKSILLRLVNEEDILDLILFVLQDLCKWKTDKINVGLKKAILRGVKIGRPKQKFIKKEKGILELRKQGFIEDEFGRKKKASYSRISRYLGISIDTVMRVSKKHNLNLKITKNKKNDG